MSRTERIKDYATDAGIRAASRASGYLREGPGGVNLEKILFYAALLGGAYLAWKTWKLKQALAVPLNAAGSAIGGKLADWFIPTPGESTFYNVEFPDKSRRAVPASSVSTDGRFLMNNVLYRLAVDKSIVSGVNKFAVKL